MMGIIIERKRADGTTGYTVQIRKKKAGKTVYSMSQTFDRKQAADAWMTKTEKELRNGTRLPQLRRPEKTLAEVITEYVADLGADIGKTKRQCLGAIQKMEIATKSCSDINATILVQLARTLKKGRKAQTVGNYMMHLSAVFSVALIAYNAELDQNEMREALKTCRRLNLIKKSGSRSRRPSLGELEKLMARFECSCQRTNSSPMHKIIGFAIVSTRRLSEITRLLWSDYEPHNKQILVRDMKHPGEKEGNDVWVKLRPKAMKIIESMPKIGRFIFPFNPDSISTAFTRACVALEIEDLHFHDLRHEGCSIMAEKNWSIPRIQNVSGHRDWNSLQRYSHVEKMGDKLKGWSWWKKLAEPETPRRIKAMQLKEIQKKRELRQQSKQKNCLDQLEPKYACNSRRQRSNYILSG
jgi:integrase